MGGDKIVLLDGAGANGGGADPRGGSDGRAHWRNQDLYGPGIPECG